jgi:hypothetical protein
MLIHHLATVFGPHLNLEHIARASADFLLNAVATLFFLRFRDRRRCCFPDCALANFTISLPRMCYTEFASIRSSLAEHGWAAPSVRLLGLLWLASIAWIRSRSRYGGCGGNFPASAALQNLEFLVASALQIGGAALQRGGMSHLCKISIFMGFVLRGFA